MPWKLFSHVVQLTSNVWRREILRRGGVLVFRVPGQRHPTSLFSVICDLLALIVDHGKFSQFRIWVLHDLLNLGRLPSMIAPDQFCKLDLVVDRHGSPRDVEERSPLRTQMIDDILNASVSNANHYNVLTMCYGIESHSTWNFLGTQTIAKFEATRVILTPPDTLNHLEEGEVVGQDDQGSRASFSAELYEGFW